MKLLQFIFRVGASLFIAFIASFSSAVIFFGYSQYKHNSDRVFLVIVPTLAIGFLLFQAFPKFWALVKQGHAAVPVILGSFAVLGAVMFVLPAAVSRVYYLAMAAVAVALFILMLPAIPAIERVRPTHSMGHYFLGFLLGLFITYATMGFLNGVFTGRFAVITFSTVSTIVGSIIGYYLVRRASHSLHDGFLSNPIGAALVISLPFFLAVMIYVCVQYPAMFTAGYIQIPAEWFGMFLASAVVGGAWGIPLLEQFETRGYYQSFKQTQVFAFIKDNLPGIFAGGMFFFINLVIARALNHPTYSLNSVIFEADAGPWMSILGYPEGHDVNRAVHPLVLITLRPMVSFVRLFLADKWYLGPMIIVALMNALCVFMGWLFVKRATQKDTYAFLFAIMLGVTAGHLLFGSLTETYAFGMTSLIFFFLLIQADEKRFSVLVPAGLLVFGITVTNIAQSMIGLFFKKFNFWRLVYFGVILLATSVALTAFVSVLYPHNQTFFYVPADLAFEGRFSKPIYEGPMDRVIQRVGNVGRSIFLYGVVAPTPLEAVKTVNTDPIIYYSTYDYYHDDHQYAWYKGLAYVPLGAWLVLLAGALVCFFKNMRSSIHMPLMLGLLVSIAFSYLLHMNYGTELFLYSPFWTYLLVFFIALAFAEFAGSRWFEIALAIFIILLMVNNAWFINVILRGLNPYLAAA
jgi:hypothetical protein